MNSVLRLFLFLLFLSGSAQAAFAPDWVIKVRAEAQAAMKKGEWEAALKVFQRVRTVMDGRDFVRADWLGWFVYHQGLAELRLERYEAAMKSFERYYKKYPSGR